MSSVKEDVVQDDAEEQQLAVSGNLLTIDPVPDVGKPGTVKAAALARLRACRLLGNLFVTRSKRAQLLGEHFYRVPVTVKIKASLLLPGYPVIFSRETNQERLLIDVGVRSSIYRLQKNPGFEESLLDRLTPGGGHFIPETELLNLDLARLARDDVYLELEASKVRSMTREWRLGPLLSASQRPGKAVTFEEVKNALVRLISGNPRLTPERVCAWLTERHFLDFWIALLQVKFPCEAVLVAEDKEEKVVKAGTLFGSALFEGVCWCLGGKTQLSGLQKLRSMMDETMIPVLIPFSLLVFF